MSSHQINQRSWYLLPARVWMAIFFAYFAFVNYQVLHIDYQYALYDRDAGDDWWRR